MAADEFRPGAVPALSFDRMRDGDFLAIGDGVEEIWKGLNQEIKDRRFQIQSALNFSQALTGTHADRLASFDATSYANGTLFYETDRTLWYVALAGVWTYAGGMMAATLAGAPTGLGSSDAGLRLWVTDFAHLVRWTGAAWEFADEGPGHFVISAIAKGTGWALCDGSSTSYLTVGAALGSTAFTTPNATDHYLKAAAAYGGITAESGRTADIGVSGSDPDDMDIFGFTAAFDVSGTNVVLGASKFTHKHEPGTLELNRVTGPLYFRR